MIDQLLPLADFIKDKKMLPFLRRVLNLLFISSITSYLFETFYFDYVWYDFTDYKKVLTFFLKGDFFIPFSIFFIVWFITYGISFAFFTVVNFWISEKYRTKIYSFSNQQKEKIQERIKTGVQNSLPARETKDWDIVLYQHLKKGVTQTAYQDMLKKMEEYKQYALENFIVIARGLIAATLYFADLPHFGWALYAIVLLTILFSSFLFVLSYQLAELLPTIIAEIKVIMETRLKEYKEKPKSSDLTPHS